LSSSAARIGYARISTADQNLDARIAVLEAAGCTLNRTEAGSGSSLEGRRELSVRVAPHHCLRRCLGLRVVC